MDPFDTKYLMVNSMQNEEIYLHIMTKTDIQQLTITNNDFCANFKMIWKHLNAMSNLKIFTFDGVKQSFIIDDTFYTNTVNSHATAILLNNNKITKCKYYLNTKGFTTEMVNGEHGYDFSYFSHSLPNYIEELTVSIFCYDLIDFYDASIPFGAPPSLRKFSLYIQIDSINIDDMYQKKLDEIKKAIKIPFGCEFVTEFCYPDEMKFV